MGVNLIRIAYSLTLGDGVTKTVLVAMADSGCDECGMAWPGVSYLERKTEFGATVVRKALASLAKQGLIHVRAYAKGGHGRATEYLVLDSLAKLSTAPCGKCQSNLANPPRRGGYDKPLTTQPTATRWVKKEPTAKRCTYPPRGGDQPSVEPYPSQNTEAENSPPARLTPPSDAPPLTDAENAAQASALIRDLTLRLGTPSPKDETPTTQKRTR